MIQWALLVITMIGLGYLVWRKPLWLVPLLAAAVALEISITWYPEIEWVTKTLGILSLTRLVSLALILAGWGRIVISAETRERFLRVIRHPLTWVLLLYIAVGGLSTIYSALPQKTIAETIRLLILFFVFVSIAVIIDKKYSLLALKTVHIAAIALAPLAFYEGLTGQLIWQAEKLMREEVLRVNATFIDPNIFARFIILAVMANLILQLFTRDRRIKLLYFACLPVLLAELVLTSSRGGLLTLGVVLVISLLLLPNRKAALLIMGLGVLAGIIVLFMAPDVWERIVSITANLEQAQPERFYLWKAAIAIFKDHPVTGTGLGTFQHVFETGYIHMRTVWEGVTISHTTVLTIASELGVIGLTVLGIIWITLIGVLVQLYQKSDSYFTIFKNSSHEFYAGAGYFLWILTVFISSQAEGRFFEDPMLWLAAACMLMLTFPHKQTRYYQ